MASRRTTKASGAAKSTTDHDEIMAWAQEKGAHPAQVKGTGIIRLDFPGFSGEETLEPITWDEFFEKFEESQLAMLLQESTASGRNSRFSKLVRREGANENSRRRSSSTRASRRGTTRKKTSAKRTSSAGDRTGRGGRKRPRAAAPKRATRKTSSKKRGRSTTKSRAR